MHEVDVQGEEGRVEVAGDEEEGVEEEGGKEGFEEGAMQGISIDVENEDGREGRDVEQGSGEEAGVGRDWGRG